MARNLTDQLGPGVAALFAAILAALDLPQHDSRLPGRSAAVLGVMKTAIGESATDADCKVLAAVLGDVTAVTR